VFTADFTEEGFGFEGDTQAQLEMLGLTYGDDLRSGCGYRNPKRSSATFLRLS
jgi:hypothetical protein